MEKRSIVKKVAAVLTGKPPRLSEMPETAAMVLVEGKISTATRHQLRPFVVGERQP